MPNKPEDKNIKNLLSSDEDPPVPPSHEVYITPRKVVPVDRQADEGSPKSRAPEGPKLWSAKIYFDPQATAGFYPERLDPVPELYDLSYGQGKRQRTQVMVLMARCVNINAREAVRHSDWLVTIGPHSSKQAIAKLLMERKAEVELALVSLCGLRGEPSDVLPRVGSVVGVALALVKGADGKAEWQLFTWFVQRPQRSFAVSFPEWGLLWKNWREWWQRLEWWHSMERASRMLTDSSLTDRWADPERKAEIDLLVRPFLKRAVTSLYAVANQDHAGLQRLLDECNVEMAKTQALPRNMPFDDLLALHALIKPEQKAHIGNDLGG